jgi:hypothetical protein
LFQIAVPLLSCLHKGVFGRIELSVGSELTTFPRSAVFCDPQTEKKREKKEICQTVIVNSSLGDSVGVVSEKYKLHFNKWQNCCEQCVCNEGVNK